MVYLLGGPPEESRAVWKAVKPFILKEKEECRDVLIGFSYIAMDGRPFHDIAGAVVESLGLEAR